jgi:integron integrase
MHLATSLFSTYTGFLSSTKFVMKSSTVLLPPLKSEKVLDQLRERIRYLHYSIRTEEVYVYWVRFFIRFHGLRHPTTLGANEVEAFLSWLVNTRGVAASTHKQALSALLFFYGKVLGVDLPWMKEIGRPRTRQRLPVVLSPDEVARLLCFLDGEHRLFAQLLYGTGMRINEGLQLRVKDVDFEHSTIIVREGKGGKDRAVMLPQSLITGLREQLARARLYWAADQAAGRGGVAMPDALERKYPRAGSSWNWFWVFLKARIRLILVLASFDGTICTIRLFSGLSSVRCLVAEFARQPHPTAFAIPLPRPFYKRDTTFVRCRNCSVTPM